MGKDIICSAGRAGAKDRPPHEPGVYNPLVNVRNKYETALEKAILNIGYSVVGGEKVLWLDHELPLEAKKRGYKRLDLLGVDSEGRYVLCELKFSGDGGTGNGDPVEADEQLLRYMRLAREYGKWFALHKDLPHDVPFDLEAFLRDSPRLMVAADCAYWDFWAGRNSRRKSRRSLSPEIEHYMIDIEANAFSRQKAEAVGEEYEPNLPPEALEWSLFRREAY